MRALHLPIIDCNESTVGITLHCEPLVFPIGQRLFN
jgi:hypothetical protein